MSIGLGSRLDITSSRAEIGNGVTLITVGVFGPTDSFGTLTIDSGGVVTHSNRLEEGVRLNVGGTLTVAEGGAIEVTDKGLRGGGNGSVFGDVAEAYNATGDTVVPGVPWRVYGAGGASSGGLGSTGGEAGPTNAAYGELENPRHLGSGGGRGGHGYAPGKGSNGGGRVTIQAGTLVVDGLIRAEGGSLPPDVNYGAYQSGAGSGGSILISAGTLSGSGLISANGGNNSRTGGSIYGGAGGGGRVAVYYGAMTFPAANITARGGYLMNAAGFTGSAGTMYLKDNANPLGSVIIENGDIPSSLYTPWRSSLPSIWSLEVTAEGTLEIGSEVVIEGPFLVRDGGKIGRP